jgi:heptaprenylglyceryl phosphate synthase
MVYKFIFIYFLATLTAIPIIYFVTKSSNLRTYLNYFFFTWVVNSIFQVSIMFIITFVLILMSIFGKTGEDFSYPSTVKYVSIISTAIWYFAGLYIVFRIEKSKKNA